MTTPKRKTTRSKRDMRRANHDKVAAANVIACEKCGDVKLAHRACPACGHYKGRKVIEIAAEAEA